MFRADAYQKYTEIGEKTKYGRYLYHLTVISLDTGTDNLGLRFALLRLGLCLKLYSSTLLISSHATIQGLTQHIVDNNLKGRSSFLPETLMNQENFVFSGKYILLALS